MSLYKIFKEKWLKQTIWIISDTHFNDTELRAGIPDRPSDEELVRHINSKVGRKDTLLLLGDVGDLEYAKQLRGYKVLIAGNHDTGLSRHKEIFDEVYEGALVIGEKLILSHEPVDIPWAFNIHGHIHDPKHKNDKYHFNVCADVIGYEPVNFNQLLKTGISSKIKSLHRDTVDNATIRKKKRGGKKIER